MITASAPKKHIGLFTYSSHEAFSIPLHPCQATSNLTKPSRHSTHLLLFYFLKSIYHYLKMSCGFHCHLFFVYLLPTPSE